VISDRKQLDYFEKQFERAVTDIGIAAYMLHPRFRGISMIEFPSLSGKYKEGTLKLYIIN